MKPQPLGIYNNRFVFLGNHFKKHVILKPNPIYKSSTVVESRRASCDCVISLDWNEFMVIVQQSWNSVRFSSQSKKQKNKMHLLK